MKCGFYSFSNPLYVSGILTHFIPLSDHGYSNIVLLWAFFCSYPGIVRIKVTLQVALPPVLSFQVYSCPNNSQSPALAGNVDWHWQDRKSSMCCNLLFRCSRSNEHNLIKQLGICSQVQTWLGFWIGHFQKIQIFGIRDLRLLAKSWGCYSSFLLSPAKFIHSAVLDPAALPS